MMDNQDQRTHTQGHDNHGVHLCHKCGWPFPNPHPSAKHRRAHKRICGTIEGYKLLDSEENSHLNGSDDERLSDDEHKSPSPKVLEKGVNENGSGKIGDKVDRAEDEVFSDAVAEFSDSRIGPGVEERFHDNSESSINVEMVGSKDPKFSEPSEDNKGLNAADVNVRTVKPSDDCQMRTPQDLQREGTEEGNTQELQGQPLCSTTDLLGASVSDLKTKGSTVVHSNSCPSKAEATSDVSQENKIHAGENVVDCSLTPVEQETTLKGKDEIKSDRGMVGIVVSSNDIVGEVCEVSEPKVEIRQIVTSDCKTVDGAVELKEKDGTECFSVQSQDDLPHDVNSSVSVNASSNGIQVDAMPVLQFVASSDPVKASEEKGEGNVLVDALSTNAGIPDVSHPQSESEDHAGMVLQNPALHSSEALRHDKYDLKENVTEEKHSPFNSIQLREENNNLSPNMLDVESSIKQKLDYCEPLAQEMLAEEPAEVSPVKLTVDGIQRSDETGASVDDTKSKTYESHMIHSSGEQDSDDACKSSQQMNLLESRDMVSTDGFEDFKDQAFILDNPSSLRSSEALRQEEEDDFKDAVTKDNHSNLNSNQLNEESEVLSPGMHVSDEKKKKQQVNSELMIEEMLVDQQDFSPVELTVDDNQSSGEIGAPVDTMKCELNQSHMVYFSGKQEFDDVFRNSQQIDLPEDSAVASFNKNPGDTSIDSTSSQTSTTTVISKDDIIHQEKHRTETDDVVPNGNSREANKENAFQFEIEPSRDSVEDKNGEGGKREKNEVTHYQCVEGPVLTDISFPKAANNSFESPVASEDLVDVSASKSTGIESTNINALSGSMGDIKEDEINNNSEVQEKCVRIIGTVADLQDSGDSKQLLKPPRDHDRKDPSLSPSNTENSAEFASAVEDNRTGEHGGESSEISTVPVQDQNSNILFQQQLGLSGIDASVDSSSRRDSLEGNWGSISVVSLQSDVPAVVDAEAVSSTDLLPTEAEKSNTNPKAATQGQQSEKSEMFDPPSFMTLVEPGHLVGTNAASSQVQKGDNPQQPNSTSSQAGWFPTLSQVVNESQGRKKNEELIAKVTNWSINKQHTPLKSLMVEASPSNKPKSPNSEENAMNQKKAKVPKDNTSGLTTVNSILGPESPADQGLKEEAAKEWNSPARYPAELKREKRKAKSRPYWIQFVCCSSVDPQRS